MSKSGPRDYESVMEVRYWLTDAGWAATQRPHHNEHTTTVTTTEEQQ